MATLLDLIDLDELLDQIEDGTSLRKLAKIYGLSNSRLHEYLHATPERAERYARALELSADALIDEGRRVLESALDKSAGIDATAAKGLNDALLKVAGWRNRKYSDKPQTAIQVNVSQQALALPAGAISPIEASKAYSRLLED